ncbi:hypothetical protein ACFLXO_00580 [Chloroflexota bacterium]
MPDSAVAFVSGECGWCGFVNRIISGMMRYQVVPGRKSKEANG